MSFMEPETTDKQEWYSVDGPMGTEMIPGWLVGTVDIPEPDDNGRIAIPTRLAEYCENREAWAIDVIRGYGVRLSAPGYLDCTSWDVYTSKREAKRAISALLREE